MAQFQRLPLRVLHGIASALVKAYRVHRDPLDLLPLRGVCRDFNAALTFRIFHTSRIKADATLGTIPSRLDPWTRAGRFLSIRANPTFFASVRSLTFSLAGAQGYYSCTARDKKRQLVDLLAAVGKHIRELTLCGEIIVKEVDAPEIRDVWTGLHMVRPLTNLKIINASGFYAPLLPHLLDRSPQVHTLRLSNGQHDQFQSKLRPSSGPKKDYSMRLDRLEVLDACDDRFLTFLNKSHYSAKRVTLVWTRRQPTSVEAVERGISTWTAFQQTKHVTICAENVQRTSFSKLKAAMRTRNIPVKCTKLDALR